MWTERSEVPLARLHVVEARSNPPRDDRGEAPLRAPNAPGLALGLLIVAAIGCQGRSTPGGGGTAPASSRDVEEARAMLEAGDADGTLARLQNAGDDPEALYLQGRAWARKAESAPIPTPPTPPSPLPKGAPLPGPPEFKPEERRAIDLLERAVALRPDLAPAHLALAQVLAPQAIRFHEREQAARAARQREASARRRPGRGAPLEPLPTPEPGVDYSPERVAREYTLAMRGDSGRPSVEALIAFAVKTRRLDDAELGYQELVRRVKESGEPLAMYGDFLVRDKKDPVAAVEQYRQALIWSPNDDVTRSKLANIFLTRGLDYFNQQQYAMADAQFAEAAKYIPDRDSPEGRILTEHQAKLREIRVR
jgi:tetratricopeptide (TPR) repeat protein